MNPAMIDTSKEAVERLKVIARCGTDSTMRHSAYAFMAQDPEGDYVTYASFAALRAELDRAEARVAKLEAFVSDFAEFKFDPISRRAPDPQDDLDPVTDWLAIEAWQDDARAALADGEI